MRPFYFLEEFQLDILCVVETWFSVEIPNALIIPSHFDIVRWDRPGMAALQSLFETSFPTDLLQFHQNLNMSR